MIFLSVDGCLGRAHIGHWREHKEHRGKNGERGEEERQISPIFAPEDLEEDRAYHDDGENSDAVERMKEAHIALGVIRRDRGYNGAEQDLRKSRGYREYYSSDHESDEDRIREKDGRERVDNESRRGYKRHDSDDQLGIEILREEAEDQVDRKLGTEIDQHERTEEGVGNAVHIVEGHEKQRWEGKYRRHSDVRRIAGEFGSFIIWHWSIL